GLVFLLAIRSFHLGYVHDDPFAKSFRSAQIRHLERALLYEHVCSLRAYPPGNSKWEVGGFEPFRPRHRSPGSTVTRFAEAEGFALTAEFVESKPARAATPLADFGFY